MNVAEMPQETTVLAAAGTIKHQMSRQAPGRPAGLQPNTRRDIDGSPPSQPIPEHPGRRLKLER
jgi:hypothetical protein